MFYNEEKENSSAIDNKALAILNCYGIEKISENFSIFHEEEEITAWAILGLKKEGILSFGLSSEEIVELYYLSI
jgi:hypothetical protein